jgi:glycosyltransferase involved in cell wall biosynthesis
MEACRTLQRQTYRDFELCISDDSSTDGRTAELIEFLTELSVPVVYYRHSRNVRYDANLRSAISLASGKFCLLMGNDDCLTDEQTLERLQQEIANRSSIGVVVTNYEEYEGGRQYRRVPRTAIVSCGAAVAASRFRNLSFVSGVILRRDRAQAHATDRWDGSEMYQMYLGSRIVAEGFDLLEIDQVSVRKGISIPGDSVDSYAARPRVWPCPVVERITPLVQVGGLVFDAVSPYAAGRLKALGVRIFLQLLLFTYGFWIVEYRRVQSWKYAVGICLGMRPKNVFRHLPLGWPRRVFLCSVYGMVTGAGLLLPIVVFDSCRSRLHAAAKSIFCRP